MQHRSLHDHICIDTFLFPQCDCQRFWLKLLTYPSLSWSALHCTWSYLPQASSFWAPPKPTLPAALPSSRLIFILFVTLSSQLAPYNLLLRLLHLTQSVVPHAITPLIIFCSLSVARCSLVICLKLAGAFIMHRPFALSLHFLLYDRTNDRYDEMVSAIWLNGLACSKWK